MADRLTDAEIETIRAEANDWRMIADCHKRNEEFNHAAVVGYVRDVPRLLDALEAAYREADERQTRILRMENRIEKQRGELARLGREYAQMVDRYHAYYHIARTHGWGVPLEDLTKGFDFAAVEAERDAAQAMLADVLPVLRHMKDAAEAMRRELETCQQDRDILACDNASMRARLARAELLAYSHADEAS